jgi:hypothetical protein
VPTAQSLTDVAGPEIRPQPVRRFPWWLPVVLALPALIPLLHSIVVPYLHGKVPTGFIQDDMPYYMANAREHFDQGFQLTYGNPYAGYDTPAIYFQPHILLLACLERAGLPPAVALNLFGLAALFFAAWVAVRFYSELVGLETRAKKLGLLCFFWGGGLLIAAGALSALRWGLQPAKIWKYDISYGWWMFNFGRNLVYPTEAYYHGVFLLSLLCLIRRKFVACLALALLLSISHPFTGLSLALILAAYSAAELFLRSKAVTPLVLAGASLIALCHAGYYMLFLSRFADHRALKAQWELAWLYKPFTYVPALIIVAGFVLVRFIRPPGVWKLLQDPRNRLFVVWFLVIFGLTQHNLLVKPFQPIHFAHGYDWIALFFLAAPLLVLCLERWRTLAVAALVFLMLSDNIAWFAGFWLVPDVPRELVLTKEQKGVLDWLAQNTAPPDMVVSDDRIVSYLVSTYTSARSWQGHMYNTPYAKQRQAEIADLFQNGRVLLQWQQMRVYYISSSATWAPPPGASTVYQNASFSIWRAGLNPAPLHATKSASTRTR